MKKNILSGLLILCMGLLVACSDHEEPNEQQDSKQVHISAILPTQWKATNGAIDETHKLRTILELWSKGETPALVYHGEVTTASMAEAGNLYFDFTLEAGTYDCLMWADYIDAAATASEKMPDNSETPFMYYAGKYYNTDDLRNVTLKDGHSFVNNDACDAFFYSGELVKQPSSALRQDVTLTRPISKVTVKEKNMREFNLLTELKVSFNLPSAFNVATQEASTGTVAVTHKHANFNPAEFPDGTLFSVYAFANDDAHKLGEVNLSFTTKRLPLQEVTIPNIIPLIRGQHVQVGGSMMGVSPDPEMQFEITYDINVTDWTESRQDVAVTEAKPNPTFTHRKP